MARNKITYLTLKSIDKGTDHTLKRTYISDKWMNKMTYLSVKCINNWRDFSHKWVGIRTDLIHKWISRNDKS